MAPPCPAATPVPLDVGNLGCYPQVRRLIRFMFLSLAIRFKFGVASEQLMECDGDQVVLRFTRKKVDL
jgi:hypothetical protein